MRKPFVAIVLLCLVAWGCSNPGDGNWQSTVHDAAPSTGTGNTGHAGTATPGPSMNSQSATEARREGRER